MQIDALAYASHENRAAPTPITDLCKRVRFRQSECQVCVDICPTNAISLPFGPELSDACINCGLCQIACPTETIEGIHNTDQMMLDLLGDQADTIINGHKLHVHCYQAEADNAYSVAVNCLGNMTENALLAMAGSNVKTLMLTTGNCSGCRLCPGMELFKHAVTTYANLSNMIAQSAITIAIRESEKQNAPPSSSTVSRREFFRSLGTGMAKQVAKVVVNKEQQIRALLQTDDDATVQKRPSPRRQMLKALFTELLLVEPLLAEPLLAKPLAEQRNDPVEIPAGVDFPWKKMHVDVAHCVGCGVCVNVCPTGALVKEVHDLELMRTINHSLCTNCDVCAEACPQDVIRFEQAYSLSDIVTDTEEEVARVALNACVICGEIIPASEGAVCTTCQKRQMLPLFM